MKVIILAGGIKIKFGAPDNRTPLLNYEIKEKNKKNIQEIL